MKNVVNIVNFIRACEPRCPMDLYEPVVKQIELANRHDLPTTFLFQYDALILPQYTDLFKEKNERFELGLWLETPKPLVEAVGLKWRGREGFDWDWFSHVGMLVGYTLEERKAMLDECMNKFKEIFGYYPKTVGCWALDGYSLNYLDKTYGLDAAMICKEQWGTDGYSLWGGYYSEAYYPSQNNMFCPADSEATQINIPVFRMLGSDPIDQYMNGLGKSRQGVETLEPSCGAGKDPEWINWYLNTYFDNNNIGINYTQAGQENSFGWNRMHKGLIIQYEIFAKKRAAGEIEVLNSAEIGRRFKEMYKVTPCTTTVARKEHSSTAWFNNKNYRASIYFKDSLMLLRDIFIFDEKYRERYFENVAEGENLTFDNLPLIDCYRWSAKDGDVGGGYFVDDGQDVEVIKDFDFENIGEVGLKVTTHTNKGDITLTFHEKEIEFRFPTAGFSLDARVFTENYIPCFSVDGNVLKLQYNDTDYCVTVENGTPEITKNGYRITANNDSLTVRL